MEKKFKVYKEVINELISEAVSCTPPNWTRGILNITIDGQHINYMLKNDTEEGKAVISEKLMQLCEKTYVTFSQTGDSWIEANFCFSENENGTWGLKTEFIYPETQNHDKNS